MEDDASNDESEKKSPPPDEDGEGSVEVDAELAHPAAAATSATMDLAATAASRGEGNGDDNDVENDDDDDGETAPSMTDAQYDESAQTQAEVAEAQEAPRFRSRPSERAARARSSNRISTTSSTCTNVIECRFPSDEGPGAYHVVPRTRASLTDAPTGAASSNIGIGDGNSVQVDTESVMTEAEVLAATVILSTVETQPNNSSEPSAPSSAGVGDAEISGGEAQADVAVNPEVTATAYLVEDRQELEDLPSAEVVDLDEIPPPPPEPFHRRREGRVTLLVVGILVLVLAILLGKLLTNGSSTATELPTQVPTFDPRPALDL